MNDSVQTAGPRGFVLLVREEWFLGVGIISSFAFAVFASTLVPLFSSPLWLALILVWLFVAILGSIFGVVRHADQLAIKLGEPYGTLILTLAVTVVEVVAICTMMLHGGSNPTLVRDTLFAAVMIILNGMVGLCLLAGGWRHREQQYNFQGANAYLSVIIPLAVLSLILPNFTLSSPGPTLSIVQEIFLALMAVALYGTFLVIQTSRHRQYFISGEDAVSHHKSAALTSRILWVHVTLLGAFMAPVVFLAEQLAKPMDYLVETFRAPDAICGVIIASLVAAPEAISAVRAARANQLQRSVNIVLGSVLATIGLTVPTMLVISHLVGKKFVLGLQNSDLVLLPLTLVVSVNTFASGRGNILQGVVHLLLFAAYLMLLFQH
jgi:Ca2+:H+ antiporter